MEPFIVKEEAGDSRNVVEGLCRGCLSSNRKLSFAYEYKGLLMKICDFDVKNMSSNLHLCWECISILKKVKSFSKRVETANYILKCALSDRATLEPLTTLSISETKTTDSFENIEEDKPELSGIPTSHTKPIIKEEYDIDIDTDNFDNIIDYNTIDDIKDEAVETILKHIKKEKVTKPLKKLKRTKHYKMIIKNHSDMNDMIETVPLDDNEVCLWMERDRKSELFKKITNKCNLCLRRLSESHKDHYAKCHKKSSTRPFSCEVCKVYLKRSSREAHFRDHTGHTCTICRFQCFTKWGMVYHIRMEHSRLVQCLDCDATFQNTREFFKHYRIYHSVFICNDCGFKTHCRDVLIRHITRNHATKYICESCNVTFKSRNSYRSHMTLQHTIERTEASFCVQCNIQFNNIWLYRRHVRSSVAHLKERCEKPKKEIFKCSECPNTYHKKYSLRNHFRYVHTNNSRYFCTDCNLSFLNNTKLVNHRKRVHENYVPEKNKLCPMCGRGFSTNRILENHIRTHTGERPFACKMCQAKFTQKCALISHIKFIHLKARRKTNNYV